MVSLTDRGAETGSRRPLVLVTRPREDAEGLVEKLAGIGCDSLVEPLMTIVPEAGGGSALDRDLDACQAILATSANGIRVLSSRTKRRDLPIYAVGQASATAAAALGFSDVVSADGDVRALAALVELETRKGHLNPAAGSLFHPAGSVVAGDLKSLLERSGHHVLRQQLYRAVSTETLSADCVAALTAGRINIATFLSPRTADLFSGHLTAAGLRATCAAIDGVCLSPAVADRLQHLPWRTLYACGVPTQDAMLDRIRQIAEENQSTP